MKEKQLSMVEKKNLLIKILNMSLEECKERIKICQSIKKGTAHRFYNGRKSNGKNEYKENPDYAFENARVEQMWLNMKINGDEKWLRHFLETSYKFA